MSYLMHGLILSSCLFVIGLFGVMIRRNLFFLLLSLMVMNNGAIIAFFFAGNYWHAFDGQLISILAMFVTLSEAGVGLALLTRIYYRRKTINIDSLSDMKG